MTQQIDYELVKETIRIDELFNALGIDVSSRVGNQWTMRCPLPSHHGVDRNPSCTYNINDHVYYCFACGVGGDLRNLVSAVAGLGSEEAEQRLAEYSDAAAPDVDVFQKQLDKWFNRQPEKVEREFNLPIYRESVIEPYVGQNLPYFRSRGISDSISARQRLGFDYNRKRGSFTGSAAIIPHVFGSTLRGWQERWLDHGSEGFPDWIPKYTNTKDFPRKETVYNYDKVDRSKQVIVVESALTVCTILSHGYEAVATFSAGANPRQVKLLRALDTDLILAYDNDKVGREATNTLIAQLENYVNIEVWKPSGLKNKADLGETTKDELEEQMRHYTIPSWLY